MSTKFVGGGSLLTLDEMRILSWEDQTVLMLQRARVLLRQCDVDRARAKRRLAVLSREIRTLEEGLTGGC